MAKAVNKMYKNGKHCIILHNLRETMHKSSILRKPEIDSPSLEIEDLEHQNRQRC
jgi:hypothetical protein